MKAFGLLTISLASILSGNSATLPTVSITAGPDAIEPYINPDGSLTAGQNGSFTITRSGSLASLLSVHVSLLGGGSTATPHDQFSPPPGICGTSEDFEMSSAFTRSSDDAQIDIGAGQASATVTIIPYQDTLCNEGAESVVMTIKANSAYTVGVPNAATIHIQDRASAFATVSIPGQYSMNEGGSTTVRISRNCVFGVDLVTPLFISGSASYTTDYTLSVPPNIVSSYGLDCANRPMWRVYPLVIPWYADSIEITIQAIDDGHRENDETIDVSTIPCITPLPPGQTVTITDSGVGNQPSPPTPIYTTIGNTQIKLNWAPVPGATSYTVKRAGPGRDACSVAQYTTIASGLTLPQYKDSGPLANGAPNLYRYKISASNASGEGPDSPEILVTPTVPSVFVSISAPLATTAEGSAPGKFTITRSSPYSGNLEVSYTISSASAVNGIDYTSISNYVNILAGLPSTDILIYPIDDATAEPNETVVITLSTDVKFYSISGSGSATVTITDNDNPPVVATTQTPLNYTENAVATAIDPGLVVSDVDSANLANATVSIISGFVASQDLLGFANQNGISGTYNSASGVLSLTGSASKANYQVALRSVTYRNTSDNPSATRTISFGASDGTHNSAAANRGINITAVNDAPVVTTTQTTLNYYENSVAIPIDLGLILSDPDNASLASATASISSGFVASQDLLAFANQNGISGTYNSASGIMTLTGSSTLANYQTALRSVSYRNTSDNPTTARTISFKANDGSLDSAIAFRPINVIPVNDPPTLDAISDVVVNINSSQRVITLSGIGAGGGESQTLLVTAASGNTSVIPNPTIVYSSPSSMGTLSFSPISGAYGSAVITVTVNDQQAANNTISQTFTVRVLSPNPTLSYIGMSGDGNFTPVAALGIDQYGYAAGFGLVPTGFSPPYYEYPFYYNEDVVRLNTSDNANCVCTYWADNPNAYTGRANAIFGSSVVGYLGYDGSDVPSSEVWINSAGCTLECPGPILYSEIKAISANGYIAGYFGGSRSAHKGTLAGWSATLSGIAASTFTSANGINVGNEVVGVSRDPADNNLKACYWDASGTLTTLPILSGYTQSEAQGINDNGWIVGYAMGQSDSTKRACLWQKIGQAYQATDLGVLVQGSHSVATAVNNGGQVVGYSAGRACRWVNTAGFPVIDLNSKTSNAGGKVLVRAYGINEFGTIAGSTSWGTEINPSEIFPVNNTANAFLVTPIPDP